MSDLIVSARYTRNSGDDPATGLTLSDIDVYLTAVHRSTGATTVIWDGTQHPTFETDNIGAYGRIYTGADLDTYAYLGGAVYTGAVGLDSDWVAGVASITEPPIGTSKEHDPYIVQTPAGVVIEGVEVWYYTSADRTGPVVWHGVSDAFGQPRDEYDWVPRLDAGTYYIFRQKAGYTFDDPDIEVVT